MSTARQVEGSAGQLRTRSMRSRLTGLLVVGFVVGATQLLLGAGTANADPTLPAETCFSKPTTYVLGKPVLPAGTYCVPVG